MRPSTACPRSKKARSGSTWGTRNQALEWSGRARDHADEDSPLFVELVHRVGRIALVKEMYESAVEPLRFAFEHDPETSGHGRLLALALEYLKRHQGALEVVEESLHHWPDDHELEVQRIRLRLILFGPETLPPGATIEYPTTD